MAGAGELLGLLRHGRALTRSQIIAESGLSRVTVTARLESLLASAFIVSDVSTHQTGGRPAEAFRLNADRGALLVADIGGSHTRTGIADLNGRILATRDHDLDVNDGPESVLEPVDADFAELIATDGRELLGIAVGVPGPVEYTTGRIVRPPTMRGWDGFCVRSHFSGYGVPIQVDKDANILAVGEHRALSDVVDDVLVIKVGMGIGAGIIAQGRILRGSSGAAGDLGHIPRAGGAQCRCGQSGCAEATAGGWAIAARLRDAGFTDVRTSSDIVELTRRSEPLSLALVREAGRRIGEVVADAIGVLNPSLVIVAGNLAEAHEPLIAGIRERVYQTSHPLATKDLAIVISSIGPEAGLRGAAQLAVDAALAPRHVEDLLARG